MAGPGCEAIVRGGRVAAVAVAGDRAGARVVPVAGCDQAAGDPATGTLARVALPLGTP